MIKSAIIFTTKNIHFTFYSDRPDTFREMIEGHIDPYYLKYLGEDSNQLAD